MRLTIDRLSSPIGTLLLVSDDDGRVRALDFDDYEARMLRLLKTHYGDTTLAPGPAPAPARRALDAYFAGDLTAIDDVPVATGGTPFQRAVWAAVAPHPGRHDDELWRSRGNHRPPLGDARGRPCRRLEPGRRHRAVPPGDRRRSFAHRLRAAASRASAGCSSMKASSSSGGRLAAQQPAPVRNVAWQGECSTRAVD